MTSPAASFVTTALLALAGLALAGCEPTLSALGAPPPGREASLDADAGRVALSEGIALPIECRGQTGPCESLAVESDDASIADARLAYRDELASSTSGPRVAAAFVLIGRATGTTTVRVRSGDGDRVLSVEVVEAP